MAKYDPVRAYLLKAGVKVPGQDELTKAQIDERNKDNPLIGYGFQSSQDKQRAVAQRGQDEALMKAYQDQAQQQMLARMSPQGQIGYYGGKGVASALGGLFGKKPAPTATPDTKNDPEVDRFNELAGQVGPSQAKVMLGQELVQSGNPAGAKMMQDGQDEVAKQQKSSTELEKNQLDIAVAKDALGNKNKPYKVGQLLPVDVTSADGKPAKATYKVTGYDSGGMPTLSLFKEGIKGSVQGPSDSFGNTKPGVDKRLEDIDNTFAATGTAFDQMDRMKSILKETPSAGGWSGQLIAKADNIYSGIKGIASSAGVDDSLMNIDKYKWTGLEKTARDSSKLKAVVLEIAGAKAKAMEGGKLSEGDIQRQIDIIGGGLTNPRTAMAVLDQAGQMSVSNLENKLKYTSINDQPLINHPRYKEQLQQLKARAGMQIDAGVVRMKMGDKFYNIPSDKVDDAIKDGLSRAE